MRNRWIRGRVGRAVALGALVTSVAGCWPAPGQGPDRSGHNAFESTITPATAPALAPVLEAPVEWPATSGLVAGAGSIYAWGGNIASLVALDPATGAIRWARSGGWRARGTGAFVDGDEVVFSTSLVNNSTALYDAATGTPIADSIIGGVEAIRGDKLLGVNSLPDFAAMTGTTTVEVVDRAAPAAGWQGAAWHGPITDLNVVPEYTLGERSVYGSGDGLLTTTPGDATMGNAIRAFPVASAATNCGAPAGPAMACPTWVTPIPGQDVTAPVLAPGETTVIVGTDSGTVHALDAVTGAPRWTAEVGAPIEHEPALANGTLVVPTTDGRIVAFDTAACESGAPAACTPSWQADLGDTAVSGQPAIAGGVIAVTNRAGTVAAFDAAGCASATCTPLWSTDLATDIAAAPIITNGRLWVVTSAGTLHAYAPS